MIKKDWGVQTNDGREGMMNPLSHTSWHRHTKDTRIKATGRMYLAELVLGRIQVRPVSTKEPTIVKAIIPHCLFSVDEPVTFRETGTEITEDICRLQWPEWLDSIIEGVRGSHGLSPLVEFGAIEKLTERQATQSVSQITNDADVTTSK